MPDSFPNPVPNPWVPIRLAARHFPSFFSFFLYLDRRSERLLGSDTITELLQQWNMMLLYEAHNMSGASQEVWARLWSELISLLVHTGTRYDIYSHCGSNNWQVYLLIAYTLAPNTVGICCCSFFRISWRKHSGKPYWTSRFIENFKPVQSMYSVLSTISCPSRDTAAQTTVSRSHETYTPGLAWPVRYLNEDLQKKAKSLRFKLEGW